MHVLRRAQLQRDHAGCFQSLAAVAACQRQQPEACPVAVLRVPPLLNQAHDQTAGGHADALAPVHQAFGRPLEVRAVRRRQVRDDGCEAPLCALR